MPMSIRNLKISTRLFCLTLFLLSTTIACGLTGWAALQRSNTQLHQFAAHAAQLEAASDLARMAQVQFKTQIQDWKNLLIRSVGVTEFEEHKARFLQSGAVTRQQLTELGQLMRQLGLDTAQLAQTLAMQQELERTYLAALAQYMVGDPDSVQIVDAVVQGMDRAPTELIQRVAEFVEERADDSTRQDLAAAASQYRLTTMWLLGVAGLGVLLGLAATVWIVRGIVQPLRRAVAIAQTVAAGDLTSQVQAQSQDETGELIAALGSMNQGLGAIVMKVREVSDSIRVGTEEIAAGNSDLSQRTEEQAASLEVTAASMEELASTVQHNADNVHHATDLAAAASERAGRGGQMVSQMVQTMSAIRESSHSINQITGVIDSIAFQTNILALNAAVEAARAGEQGRGFAVVAGEVRGLAQRSAHAAKDIKDLIEATVQRIGQGSALAQDTGAAMGEIVHGIDQLRVVMEGISTATSEQRSGIAQVNEAVAQMDATTQQNAALVEQAAAAAGSLEQQAAVLVAAVSAFKVHHEQASPIPAGRQLAM